MALDRVLLAIAVVAALPILGCTRPPGKAALIPEVLPVGEEPLGSISVRVLPGWVQQAATFAWRDSDYRDAIEELLLAAGVSSREASQSPLELVVSIYQVDLTTGRARTSAGIYADWTLRTAGAGTTVQRFLVAAEGEAPDSSTRIADAIASASRQSIATGVARLKPFDHGGRARTAVRVTATSAVDSPDADRWIHVLHAIVASRLQDQGYPVFLGDAASSSAPLHHLEIVLSSLDDVGETQRAFLGALAGSAKVGLMYRLRGPNGAEVAGGSVDSKSKAGFMWDEISESTTGSASRAVSEQILTDVLPSLR